MEKTEQATVSINGGPEVPVEVMERAVSELERRADEITGARGTFSIGFRATAVMDAFPEEGDRDVIWNALVLMGQALIATGKAEKKVGNATDETVDKLIRIRGDVTESGTVKVPGLLKLIMPKRDVPEFLTELVLDRQLGLGI